MSLSEDMRTAGVDDRLVVLAEALEARLAQITLLLRAGLLISECLDDRGQSNAGVGAQLGVEGDS